MNLDEDALFRFSKKDCEMKFMKSKRLYFLVVGLVLLAALGFNITSIQAHGHGGGGHGGGHGGGRGGGGFGGGGHHHGAHPHEHLNQGSGNDSHYRHDHDDYGDHRHDCRTITDTSAGTDRRDPHNEECQNHDGAWEPSAGE